MKKNSINSLKAIKRADFGAAQGSLSTRSFQDALFKTHKLLAQHCCDKYIEDRRR